MGSEHDSAVLAARVLSYLKRMSGKGLKPSITEEKAAAAALQLLTVKYHGIADNSSTAVENLSKIARKGGQTPGASEISDQSNAANVQMSLLNYQQAIGKLGEMQNMLSKIQQSRNDMVKGVIANIR